MRKDVTPRNNLLDRRVVERNIRKGIVTREEYDKSLSELPDVGGNAVIIAARLGEDDEHETVDSIDASDED